MVGKKRQKLTTENIFEKPPYISILNLLIEFQDKDFQGKKGLKPIHFRYVLEMGYKDSKKSQVRSNIKRLKTFFGGRLDFLISNDSVIPECITSRQNLTKFLNNLKNPPIRAIEKIGSKSDVRYRIKKEFYYEGIRIENKRAFDSYSLDHILCFFYKYPHRHQTIYGIPQKLFKCFTEEEKNIIEKHLVNVDKQLRKIQDVRIKVRERECNKRLNHFLDNTKSEKIKKLIQERGNLICSRNLPLYESFAKDTIWAQCERSGTRVLDFLKDADKVTERRFWSEIHFNKDYDLSPEEIQEIKQWWKDNEDIMDIHQKDRQISFSRYF